MRESETSRRFRCSSAFLRRIGAVSLTAAVGAGVSLILFATMHNWERRVAQDNLEAIARQRMEILRESLGSSLGTLHALGGLYSTGLAVDRESFRKFVAPAFEHSRTLQALSWTPKVPAAQREMVENLIREEGFAGFEFTERDPQSGKVRRARDQSEAYFPILLIEPLEQNRTAFGRDLGNPPGTAFRARDAGHAVASSLIRLRQEARNQPGLIVHLPLYDGPVPDTVEERREKLTGFVSAVFRIGDLLEPIRKDLRGVRVLVSDRSPLPLSITYEPSAGETAPVNHRLEAVSLPLAVADRTLLFTFTPTLDFPANWQTWHSWTALLGGLVMTMLCCAWIRSSLKRNHEIAIANAALQAEVLVRKTAEETAAAANKAKSSFVSHLSHEIRTPLNAILGYAQLLEREGSLPAREREFVNAIAMSGRHLLSLLNSVLDLARVEAGRAELRRDAFNLSALVSGLSSMFLPKCQDKQIALRLEPEVPAHRDTVLGDEGKLRQVLINLLGNAIKFTQKGGVTVRVAPAGDDRWKFEVIDTGIGLAESERIGLFRPFYQTAEGSQ